MLSIFGYILLLALMTSALAYIPGGPKWYRRVIRWWGRQARALVELFGRAVAWALNQAARLANRHRFAVGVLVIIVVFLLIH